jgi:hypothetical protein
VGCRNESGNDRKSDKFQIMPDAKLTFSATIHKLGINPCVDVPANIVATLLQMANKKSAPVQVKCDLNGTVFDANVVRYMGNWRLYLNTPMRKSAKKDVGDTIRIKLNYDPTVRMPSTPEAFRQALRDDKNAQKAWRLRPTPKRREILQSLNGKKTDAELARSIAETIELLLRKR